MNGNVKVLRACLGDTITVGKLPPYYFVEDCDFHSAQELTDYLHSKGHMPNDMALTDDNFRAITAWWHWGLEAQ